MTSKDNLGICKQHMNQIESLKINIGVFRTL